jgi:hypothetical protein
MNKPKQWMKVIGARGLLREAYANAMNDLQSQPKLVYMTCRYGLFRIEKSRYEHGSGGVIGEAGSIDAIYFFAVCDQFDPYEFW